MANPFVTRTLQLTDSEFSAEHLTDEGQGCTEHAVAPGIRVGMDSWEAKILEFVDSHFSFRGALALHRETLGRDFFKVTACSQPAAGTTRAFGSIGGIRLGRTRCPQVSRCFAKRPPGLKTADQKEVYRQIQSELLVLPFSEATGTSAKDAELAIVRNDPELSIHLAAIERQTQNPGFRAALEGHLVNVHIAIAGDIASFQ